MCRHRDDLKRQEAHVKIRLYNLQQAREVAIEKLVPRSARPARAAQDSPSSPQHTTQQPVNGTDSESENDDDDEHALDEHSIMTADGEIQPAPLERNRRAYGPNVSDFSLGVDASGESGVAVRRRTCLIEQAPSSPGLCVLLPVLPIATRPGDRILQSPMLEPFEDRTRVATRVGTRLPRTCWHQVASCPCL